jgi:hypothetical protein
MTLRHRWTAWPEGRAVTVRCCPEVGEGHVPEVTIPWWDWTSAAAHQDGLPPTHAAQAREDGRPTPLFDSEVLLPRPSWSWSGNDCPEL